MQPSLIGCADIGKSGSAAPAEPPRSTLRSVTKNEGRGPPVAPAAPAGNVKPVQIALIHRDSPDRLRRLPGIRVHIDPLPPPSTGIGRETRQLSENPPTSRRSDSD